MVAGGAYEGRGSSSGFWSELEAIRDEPLLLHFMLAAFVVAAERAAGAGVLLQNAAPSSEQLVFLGACLQGDPMMCHVRRGFSAKQQP